MNQCVLNFLLAAASYYWRHECDRIAIPVADIRPNYDFIVVGGGSGGSVVASRLSEEPSWKVLLIEDGGSDNKYADVPYLYLSLDRTLLSKHYWTVPQATVCKWHNENRCPITIGHGLGGGSSHNGLLWARGSRLIYDKYWAPNASGWSYDELLPYFIKSENVSEI